MDHSIHPAPTGETAARKIFPSLDQERADARQAEIERPFKEHLEYNKQHEQFNNEKLKPWQQEKNTLFIARLDAYGDEGRTHTAIGALLENYRQLGLRIADVDYRAQIAAIETGEKVDRSEGDSLREVQRKIVESELPQLVERRAKQRKAVAIAEKEWADWLADNPMPTFPLEQFRPSLLR